MVNFVPYVVAFILCLPPPSLAQNYTIPNTWRKPTSNATQDERFALVQGILDTMVPTFDEADGLPANLFISQCASLLSAMALGDRVNSSTTSLALVTSSINTVFTTRPNITTPDKPVNSDLTAWGLAAIDSYRAYKDQASLGYAKLMWDELSIYMITPANAVAGNHPMRDTSFLPSCNGASVAGGVLWIRESGINDTDVNASTVGEFMTLSIYLYEATMNSTYLTAAELSAAFITTQLYTGVVIDDTITLETCEIVNSMLTYNSGYTIQGLTALVPYNNSFVTLLDNLIPTAISFEWTNDAPPSTTDGVNTEGAQVASDAGTNEFIIVLKALLIHGLFEAWLRSDSDSPVAKLIASYITVQFNALLDLATTPGTNHYSPRWQGPPSTSFLPWGQLGALDVMVAAAGIGNASTGLSSVTSISPSASNSSSSPPPNGSHGAVNNGDRHRSSPTPALIGGIVGGIVLLVAAGMLSFGIRRRRIQRRESGRRLSANEGRVFFGPRRIVSSPPDYSPSPDVPATRQTTAPPVVDSSHGFTARPLAENAGRRPKRSNSHSATAAVSSAPASDALPNTSRPSASQNVSTTGPSAPRNPPAAEADLQALISRLNEVMSHLPPGGTSGDETLPPYER